MIYYHAVIHNSRNNEEKETVKNTLEKHLGTKIDLEALYGLEEDRDFQSVMRLMENKEKTGHAKARSYIN